MPSLLKNTVIYTIGRMFPQMANFILLPLYTRYLSTDGYGIVESMLVFGMILSIFLSMASERSMFRLYYDYGSIKGRMYFVGNVFLLILMSSTFFTVGLFLFDDYVTIIYESIEFNPYYVYTIVSSFCLSYSFIPMTLFQVEGKAINFIFLNIGIFLLNTAFIVFFVVIEEQGSEGYLKGKMIASIILLPVFLWIIFKRSIVKFKFEVLKNILSFSIPMIPVLIMAWVLNMSNRIFIEQYYSLEEVGVFSLAFKIASLGSIILAALFTSYNPVFYKIANEKGVRDAKPELKKVNNVIIIAVFAVLGVIAFLSEELIMVVFDSRYHLAGKLIPVLLLSVLFVQLTGLLNLMIYQQKKTYLVTIVSVVGAFTSVGLNFILVPNYGMWGAAYASALTSFFMFLLEYIFATKAYFIPMPIFRISGWLVVLSVVIYVGNYFLSETIWLKLLVKLLLIVLMIAFFYQNNRGKIQFLLKDF